MRLTCLLLAVVFVLWGNPVYAQTTIFSANFSVTTADADITGCDVVDTGCIQTPTDNSGRFAEVVDTSANNTLTWFNVGNTVYASANRTGERLLYTSSPSPSTGNYNVSMLRFASATSTDITAILVGYTDADNYCVVFWRGSGASGTDLYARKWASGSPGNPANYSGDVDATMAELDTVEVQIRTGGVGTVIKNGGPALLTFQDSACGGTSVGFGMGDFLNNDADGWTQTIELDNYLVTEEAAAPGGGPPLGGLSLSGAGR